MCEKCKEMFERTLPDFTDEERWVIAWDATAFPFCDPAMLERQINKLQKNSDGSIEGMLAYADAELDRMMIEDGKREMYGD